MKNKLKVGIVIIVVALFIASIYIRVEENIYTKLNDKIEFYFMESLRNSVYNIVSGVNVEVGNIKNELVEARVHNFGDRGTENYTSSDTGVYYVESVTGYIPDRIYDSVALDYTADVIVSNNTGYKMQYIKSKHHEAPSETLNDGEKTILKTMGSRVFSEEEYKKGDYNDIKDYCEYGVTFTFKNKNGDRVDFHYDYSKRKENMDKIIKKNEHGEWIETRDVENLIPNSKIEVIFNRNKPNLDEFEFNNYEKYLLKKYDSKFLSTEWCISGNFMGYYSKDSDEVAYSEMIFGDGVVFIGD